jgi:trehalose synthase
MIPNLNSYKKVVGSKKIKEIRQSAEHLQGKHVVHINATSMGGGVAEILNSLVFLMNDVGINTGWRVMLGSHSFFNVTKKFHNYLQGKNGKVTNNRKDIYLEYSKRNAMINHLDSHDIVIVHDPQPLGMILNYQKRNKWIWRCHIDLSNPNSEALSFLSPFIKMYDGVVVSSNKFRIKQLKKPQFIIHPSIDPLSVKNKKITGPKSKRMLSTIGIDTDKPIITQIGRFDPWKGHIGVIKMFKKIREKMDCQLVFMGDMAGDDPQGPILYHKIRQIAEKEDDIVIITQKNDLLVNVLQAQSNFVFQNSLREGFGLTVAEALWKGTPVIGTKVGGIPSQIINGKTGYVMKDCKDGVKKALKILEDKQLRTKMGKEGHEHVKEEFLITRHLQDYIHLFNKIYPPSII